MSRVTPFLLVAAVLAAATIVHGAEEPAYSVYADPDLRVTFDGDVAHMEAPIAASLTDPDLLVAAAELVAPGRLPISSPYGSTIPLTTKLYYSHNAGVEWQPISVPYPDPYGSWDQAVVGGKGRIFYFLTHILSPAYGLRLYRSSDAGVTWRWTPVPAANDRPDNWDREFAVLDNTSGRYSGRLYVVGAGSQKIHNLMHYGIFAVSSNDGGVSFTQRVPVCPSYMGPTQPLPVVLSDGALIVACYSRDGAWISRSTDGGRTFPFRRRLQFIKPPKSFVSVAKFFLAAGPPLEDLVVLAGYSGSNRYGGRLFAVWSVLDGHKRLLNAAYSNDDGSTWSAPRLVDPQRRLHDSVFQANPMVALNKDGILGIAWFDSRNAPSKNGYDIYFTASVDGGNTFLTSTRVSSVTSFPAESNFIPNTTFISPNQFHFESPYFVRNYGGDYSTMAADAAGRFHPLWPDARNGAWQLYTSTIRVVHRASFNAPSPSRQNGQKFCSLNHIVRIVPGMPYRSKVAREIVFPVRLTSISSNIINSPIMVRARIEQERKWERSSYVYASIMDRSGNYGNSSTFYYNVTQQHPLFPHGVTQSLPWHFRVSNYDNALSYVDFKITAIDSTCR